DGKGQAAGLVAHFAHEVQAAGAGFEQGVIYGHFLDESLHVGHAVDAYAHEGYVGKRLVELVQIRHFFQAGLAPGGPEVDQQRLARPTGECVTGAREVRQGLGKERIRAGRVGGRLRAASRQDGQRCQGSGAKKSPYHAASSSSSNCCTARTSPRSARLSPEVRKAPRTASRSWMTRVTASSRHRKCRVSTMPRPRKSGRSSTSCWIPAFNRKMATSLPESVKHCRTISLCSPAVPFQTAPVRYG